MKTWIPDARNFAYLNWKLVETLPKDSILLVLTTAAIEQHGHHLPLATDTLINNVLLGRALSLLCPELPIYALPPVCYGKSNEHIGFPGTTAMTATTYMSVLHDIGASLAAAGFKTLVLYKPHGGNTALNDVMARDLRAEFGLRTFHMSASAGAKPDGLNPQETKYGGSAVLVFAAMLVFRRLLIFVFNIPSYLLPTPLAVVQVAMQRLPELWSSLMISAEAAIGGLIVTITVHCPSETAHAPAECSWRLMRKP